MLAQQLQDMRASKGMTNSEIARKSGISAATVTRIFNGESESPTFQNVCDMVIAMDGSLDELVGIEKPAAKGETATDASIEALKQVIAEKEKWLKRVFVVACSSMGVLALLVLIDALNPYLGFFHLG